MDIPGFIDLQVNGYAGVDFSDPSTTPDQILGVSRILAGEGTVGFLATVTTGPRTEIEKCISAIARAIREQGREHHILGIHLEGPFISKEYGFRGAHPEEFVCAPDIDWFRRLQMLAEGNIRLVTLAPEQRGAIDFIRRIARDVIVAAGHTNCSFEILRESIDAGLRFMTHLGNGCRPMVDRHANPIVHALAIPELMVSFIPDGAHLPEAFVRMLIHAHRTDRLFVISDSVKFAGMKPGRHETRNRTEVVLAETGRLSLAADERILAGSTANMMKCMNMLASLGVLGEDQLREVGLENQCRLLSLESARLGLRGHNVRYEPETRRFSMVTEGQIS